LAAQGDNLLKRLVEQERALAGRIESAQREADEIVEEAQAAAYGLLADARTRAEAVAQEVEAEANRDAEALRADVIAQAEADAASIASAANARRDAAVSVVMERVFRDRSDGLHHHRGAARCRPARVLQSLQSLGVVQIDPLEPEEGVEVVRNELAGQDRADVEGWAAVRARIASLQEALGVEAAEPAPRSEVPTTLDEIETFLMDLGAQVDAAVAERASAREERGTIDEALPLFRQLAPTLAEVQASRWLRGVAFLAPSDVVSAVRSELDASLEQRYVMHEDAYGDQRLVLAVALAADEEALRFTLSKAGVAPLALPSRYREHDVAKAVHTMEERSQQLPKRISALEQQLAKLASQYGMKLATLATIARNQHVRLERLADLATGRYAFALQGWVPSDELRKVTEGLRKQFGEDIVMDHRPADEHHDVNVPVKLENPGWMQPFQGLLALFAPPKYGNFDPTWTLFLFFPLFFGIVVGDIAYGLIFLSVGLWLRRRGQNGNNLNLGPLGIIIPARNLPAIGSVINWAAFWSIVWGVVYGEFWGNFLERWPYPRPIFYPGDKGIFEILLFRVEVFTPLLIITLGFGALQVLLGWGIRAYYGWKHHDRKHMWEGIGMFSGLVGVVVFATAYLTNTLGSTVYAISGALLAVFLLGVVLSGVPLMLVELISNSGNILSYLRLFAVGLSAALVANLGTDAGFALNEAIVVPVLGEALGVLVAVTINLFAVILTLVGHTLQPLRLQYVEFFTKFGFYEESGRRYQPFRLHGGKA